MNIPSIGKAFLVFSLMTVTIYTQPAEPAPSEPAIREALCAMYDMDFDLAHDLFSSALGEENFHPLAPLGAIATEWMLSQARDGYDRGNQRLLQKLNITLDRYRSRMLLHPDETELDFYYGTTMGLKARILLYRKEWLGVITSGYNALRYVKKARRVHPDNIDMMLPMGTFNYYVGVSAGYMKIASWILNESGSREDGLRMMEEVGRAGNYANQEARSLLAFVYLYMENDPAKALEHAEFLRGEFPGNVYFQFLAAEAGISLGELEQARTGIDRIREGLDSLEPFLYREYVLKLHLLDGRVAILTRDYAGAENYLRYVIDNYTLESDIHLGYAYLYLGNLYDMTDRRPEALKCYQAAGRLDNRSTACTQARNFINAPFRG